MDRKGIKRVKRPCFCSKCQGELHSYNTCRIHEKQEKIGRQLLIPVDVGQPPSESEPSDAKDNDSDSESEENDSDAASDELDESQLQEIVEYFVLQCLSKQTNNNETQVSFEQTMNTIKGRGLKRVVDSRFAEGCPMTYKQALKYLSPYLPHCERIPYCPQQHILYRGANANLSECPTCQTPR